MKLTFIEIIDFLSLYLRLALGSFLCGLLFYGILKAAGENLPLEILKNDFFISYNHFSMWVIPVLLLALIYALLAAPFVGWLQTKEIYQKYYLFALPYILFVPIHILVGGYLCLDKMCYI